MKTLLNTVLLFSFCLLVLSSSVYAQNDDIGSSIINPASPFYFLKGIREVWELKFAATPQTKSIRQLEFATRRIREVKSLASSPHENLIEPTLAKYLAILQKLNSAVILSDENIASPITNEIILHAKILQQVYGQVTDPRARMSIRATIYRLLERNLELIREFNKFSKPHLAEKIIASQNLNCQFLAKESTSSALNEVEKTVLSRRSKKCFESLKTSN